MSPRIVSALAAALWLAPLAATAQSAPHAAPHATPAAAPAVAPSHAAVPDHAIADDTLWADGDLLAFGLGETHDLESSDLEDGDRSAAMDQSERPAPLDSRRGPDPMRRGPGMGMGRGTGMAPGMGLRRGWLGGRPMTRRGMPLRMRLQLAQLDLSETQRDRLRDLHEATARKAVQRRAEMQLARMDLAKLMRADKPDVGAVNSQIDRLTRLRADGLKAAFELRMQARAVLTPEQLQQLRSPSLPPMLPRDRMDAPDGRPKR